MCNLHDFQTNLGYTWTSPRGYEDPNYYKNYWKYNGTEVHAYCARSLPASESFHTFRFAQISLSMIACDEKGRLLFLISFSLQNWVVVIIGVVTMAHGNRRIQDTANAHPGRRSLEERDIVNVALTVLDLLSTWTPTKEQQHICIFDELKEIFINATRTPKWALFAKGTHSCDASSLF